MSNPSFIYRQAKRFLIPCVAICFVVLGSISSFNAASFTDFFGGRLPRSDSSGWIVGTVSAARGVKQDWVVRRPLNVAFNAPIYQISVDQSGDPLLTALLVKRLMAFAGIGLLAFSLHGVLSVAANSLLFVLLAAVLFSHTLENFSSLFGKSVGYTHGTELNGFIVVNFALAALVAATRLVPPFILRSRVFSFVIFFPGLILLFYAVLLRPGTLAMMPLVVAAISLNILGTIRTSGSFLRRFFPLSWLLAIAVLILSLSPGLVMQSLAYRATTADCGVIGGNQGYTLYGMSLGSNWNLGIRDAQKLHLGHCEREVNDALLRKGKGQILADPRPLFGLLISNLRFRLSSFFLYVLQWPVWILTFFALLRGRSRKSLRAAWLGNWQLRTIFSIGIGGWISVELFLLLFYQEAGLRPVLAYAVFPLLAVVSLIEFCVRALRLPDRASVLLKEVTEGSVAPIQTAHQRRNSLLILQRFVVVGPLILLTLQLAWGCFLLVRPNPSFASAGDQQLTGEVRVDRAQAESGFNSAEFLKQIQENYRVRSADPRCDSALGFVVRYTRSRLPGRYPLGDISLECSSTT